MGDALFIPTEIPWDTLKGRDLEELLFWLFDSMGAKDLEWRLGGTGSGTADQGRDLELSFYTSSPDNDLVQQRWWVEAKGRSSTVEPSDVKSAVVNAAGKNGIDVLVIATNSNFSNPTRDWVKEWQCHHPLPKVKLWERVQLESLCSKNPLAVIRLFSKALTAQGKLEVVTTKLWDYASLSDEPTLVKLWNERTELEIDGRALLALVASEIANGSIVSRSWGMFVDTGTLLSALGGGIINVPYLGLRADESGMPHSSLITALSYLVLVSIKRLGDDSVARFLNEFWDCVDVEVPDEVRRFILQPVINGLFDELRDVCTTDCHRVITRRVKLAEDEVKNYWDRLSIVEQSVESENKRVLVLESHNKVCDIGILPFAGTVGCPFVNVDEPSDDISNMLRLFGRVTQARGSATDDTDG